MFPFTNFQGGGQDFPAGIFLAPGGNLNQPWVKLSGGPGVGREGAWRRGLGVGKISRDMLSQGGWGSKLFMVRLPLPPTPPGGKLSRWQDNLGQWNYGILEFWNYVITESRTCLIQYILTISKWAHKRSISDFFIWAN